MTEIERSLLTYCQFMDRGRHMGQDRKHPTFEGYLLENARLFGPRVVKPEGVEWGTAKQCFYNSASYIYDDLVRRNDQAEWAYCEGLAMGSDLGLGIHHGWLVNRAGEVLDLTWRKDAGVETAYFGVAFSAGYFCDVTAESGVWGLFCPGEMYTRSLISGKDGDVVFHPYHQQGRVPAIDPTLVAV